MKKILIPVLLVSLMGIAVEASAVEKMKPGLWEMTMKSDMMKSMPKMSPEQMEMMHKMGVAVPSFQDGGMTTKVCISKAMAERDHPPEMDRKASGCESKNFQQSGSDYSVDVVCDGPDIKGSGKAAGHFSSGESFTSTYDFKGTAHGRPVTQHHETAGKWVGSDCGDVKPMDELLPKK